MGDDAPKSAYELAMERLRKKDQDEGVTVVPLTDEQRAQIAEIRNFYEAKIAEQKVLHQSALRKTLDPAERDALDQQHRREIEHLNTARDSKIEKVRRGEN
jgi:leucyl aminopeptidase (aminopeptidase T)